MARRVRVYDFPLPFTASGWQLWFGMQVFRTSKFWAKVPENIRKRAEEAANTFGGQLVITKQDLDTLDDSTWGEMANQFDLAYHYEEV